MIYISKQNKTQIYKQEATKDLSVNESSSHLYNKVLSSSDVLLLLTKKQTYIFEYNLNSWYWSVTNESQ